MDLAQYAVVISSSLSIIACLIILFAIRSQCTTNKVIKHLTFSDLITAICYVATIHTEGNI